MAKNSGKRKNKNKNSNSQETNTKMAPVLQHIIHFFNSDNQRIIRRICQLHSEKYEDALECYKKAFVTELKLMKKNLQNSTMKESAAKKFYEVLEDIDDKEIFSFFEEIRSIYICWINSESNQAFCKMKALIKDKQLFDDNLENISRKIFFRARKTKEILTPWDMFHIPFNKRYLISNQRYSLTGQPILYLGVSVLDIINELNADFNSLDDYKISTFEFKNNFDIIDLRSKIAKFVIDDPIESMFQYDVPPKKSIDDFNIRAKQMFFEYIIVSCCSFEKRKEIYQYTFCEEYVLPQLLAQILTEDRFDGMMYSSNKKFDGVTYDIEKNFFKDNIAVFTEFTDEHVYDNKLLDKLIISNPISYSDIDVNIDLNVITEICDQIRILDNKNPKMTDFYNIGLEQELQYGKIKIDGQLFFQHPIGKIQLALIYNVLYSKRNECLASD